MIEEHSLVDNIINTGEYRERGVLVKYGTGKEIVHNLDTLSPAVHQEYGAIKCLEQNELIYFSASEVISYVKFVTSSAGIVTPSVKLVELQIGDSLEFSIVKCQKVNLVVPHYYKNKFFKSLFVCVCVCMYV